MVMCCTDIVCFFFFKQKTAYEMRISDWSSDVCSSDLSARPTASLNCRAAGFTAQACAIELQCLRYGRRRRNGDRGRLEASPGPDEELIPEMVAELLEVAAKRWLGNVERLRGQAHALCAHDRSEEHTSELQSLMRNSY